MKVALRHAVTAMPLLKGRMGNKAQRFAEHVSYGVRASSRHARGLRNVKLNINSDWWDALFKMLSIVLVPLTVAGMGWYWTKWQQSVNDLKGMIDLVTDASPEKQKYGIAMFEYLAKNGKVPVEFLAAQIDYATTAQNKELLPMLEVAIQNASKENPEVAEAYRVALERRPARVFGLHVERTARFHAPQRDGALLQLGAAGRLLQRALSQNDFGLDRDFTRTGRRRDRAWFPA